MNIAYFLGAGSVRMVALEAYCRSCSSTCFSTCQALADGMFSHLLCIALQDYQHEGLSEYLSRMNRLLDETQQEHAEVRAIDCFAEFPCLVQSCLQPTAVSGNMAND